MKFRIIREIPFWVLIISPVIYLVMNWDIIPDTVPLHYNFKGEADDWGSKNNLIGLTVALPIFTYLLLLVAIYIDPKKKIQEMGTKFLQLRLVLSLLIAVIMFAFIYSCIHETGNLSDYIYIIMGTMISLLGNLFLNLKPNYFVGFRTPWALENEKVWKHTHRMGSKLWFFGGLVMIIINLIPDLANQAKVISMIIISILIIVPLVYSYTEYKKMNSQ